MLLLSLLYHDPNPRISHTTLTTIDPTHQIPLLRKDLIDTTSQIKAVVKKGKMSRERAKSSWIRGAGACEAVVGGVTCIVGEGRLK